jgi:hypothetical protein
MVELSIHLNIIIMKQTNTEKKNSFWPKGSIIKRIIDGSSAITIGNNYILNKDKQVGVNSIIILNNGREDSRRSDYFEFVSGPNQEINNYKYY